DPRRAGQRPGPAGPDRDAPAPSGPGGPGKDAPRHEPRPTRAGTRLSPRGNYHAGAAPRHRHTRGDQPATQSTPPHGSPADARRADRPCRGAGQAAYRVWRGDHFLAGRGRRPLPDRPARGRARRTAQRPGRRRSGSGPVPGSADGPGGSVHDGCTIRRTPGKAMNPIIRRELLEVLRMRKTVALQLGLGLACALLVLVRWPTGDVADLSGARSLEVLRIFGYGLLAAILLMVPAFPATSLVREKVKGTLTLLLNSPLRPWSIYLGKLGGILGFALVLLVMTLPAAAACRALGGTVIGGVMAALYAILAMAALQMCTLGLLVSSRSQSADGALRVTYALVLAVCVLTLGPYTLLHGGGGLLEELASWLRCLSPLPAGMEVLGQVDVGTQGF